MLKKIFAAAAFLPVLFAPAETWGGGAQVGNAMQFDFKSIDGSPMPLSKYAGKVLLVVNTASFCGFTRQYEGLEQLYERYEKKGLVVIGVPSNDFGEQEPKAENEIATFCQGAFGVTFPLTTKQVVKGPTAHPFYVWAKATLGDAAAPRWNFHKYLVGADGRLVASFSTQTEPLDPRLVKAVEDELATAKP